MKIAPAKVGAQPKQLIILGALVVIAIVTYLINRSPSGPEASSSAPRAAAVTTPADVQPVAPLARKTSQVRDSPMPGQRPARGESRTTDDFRPSLKLKEGTDVSRIDPTLELELLAKLRSVPMEGGSRSVFEFAQPPPPPPPKVDPIKMGKPAVVAGAKGGGSSSSPSATADKDGKAPGATAATPIPLKFYGYADSPRNGPKRAFFLDGDDIFVAGENELIRNRYKIVRIGVNSAVVEDTTTKKEQTLPLIAELAS
jgi:hypothetical protein